MDLFHGGKEDQGSDHRFVNERLLEVAIPPDSGDGKPILLEDCLELYFNNRVDVRRYLDRQDTQDTLTLSRGPSDSKPKSGNYEAKGDADPVHVEIVELDKSTSSLGTDITLLESPNELKEFDPLFQQSGSLTNRTSSIVRRRFIPESDDTGNSTRDDAKHRLGARKGSIRKEIMMPAWAIFSLIREANHCTFQV